MDRIFIYKTILNLTTNLKMKSTIKLFATAGIVLCVLGCKIVRRNMTRTTDLYGRSFQQYMRLTLLDGSGRSDDIIISLKDKASFNFEIDEDGLYNHKNSGIGLCSLSGDGVPLSVNVIPFPRTQPEVIRLGVSTFQNSELKLQTTELIGLPNDVKIKLVDRLENVSSDCRENKNYIFNSGKGYNSRADAGRFLLVIYHEEYYSFRADRFYNKKDDGPRLASVPVPAKE